MAGNEIAAAVADWMTEHSRQTVSAEKACEIVFGPEAPLTPARLALIEAAFAALGLREVTTAAGSYYCSAAWTRTTTIRPKRRRV